MSSDSASSKKPDSPEAASASPDYVSGLGEPKQAPPSLDYVPCPEYPEYLAPTDDEIVVEDQPYADSASLVALSPGYVVDSDPEKDPEEDSEDGPADYPADGGGDDDDDDSSDDDEEEEEASEETKPFEMDEFTVTPPPPPLGLGYLSEPRHLCLFHQRRRCLAAPALPSSPLPIVPHPYGSPNHVRAPPGFRAAMGRLRASSPSTHHPLHPSPPLPPLPSSLYLPPPVPTSSPLPSPPLPPLPPLPASLFIPPPVDRREDIPEVELPPHKRLCMTALTSRYEVGESSTTARHTGGHRVNYRFIDTLDAETRCQRAEEVGYGIMDVWVDPTEAVEEIAPTTLEGVNARVTELAQDAQDRQTRLSQRVDVLIKDIEFHQETVLLMEQEALVSREAWAQSVGLSSANIMPPKRTSVAAAKAAAAARAAVAAAAPKTVVVVEQLIEARVSAALANHETL
ncbi:hypothetical protein Tco_1368825 [Tanacetum coccineum]